LFAPKQRQQDFDPLMRLHVGEDRQPPSEGTTLDPDMVAAPKRAGFAQLHQPSNLSATNLGNNPIGNARWTSSIHDQPHDAWGVPGLRPLQLNQKETLRRSPAGIEPSERVA
jgi:hypothetical protein